MKTLILRALRETLTLLLMVLITWFFVGFLPHPGNEMLLQFIAHTLSSLTPPAAHWLIFALASVSLAPFFYVLGMMHVSRVSRDETWMHDQTVKRLYRENRRLRSIVDAAMKNEGFISHDEAEKTIHLLASGGRP